MLLEVLAAVGAVVALAVAVRPAAGARVRAAVLAGAALSLAVSGVALAGDDRSSGWLSMLESFGLLALVFLALRRAGSAAAALLAAAAAVAIIPAHDSASDELLPNLAGMALWGCGALVAAVAARHLDALDARRARSVADARREQRLALARDLHDFVAHDVSAIVVQAQAGQVVAAEDPRHALAALERIERAGLHALGAMDRAVEALRDAGPAAHPHGVDDLRALTARFSAAAPARAELALDDGVADALPSEVGSTVHRIVSEALTNVLRHAPDATRVDVHVARARLGAAPAVAVRVVDDGGRPEARARRRRHGGGLGLAGLREHVEALGGTLEAGPHEPTGWELAAVLPDRRPR